MINIKYIVVFLALTSTYCFSQTTFSNLDSLLTKNFESVNKRDSVYYISLINKSLVFKDKKTKTDSVLILQPFIDSFNDLIASLTDMTTSSDFTVSYLNYECKNKKITIDKVVGKIPLHVNILVNNTFTLKLPFVVYALNGIYSIETPMMVMFVDTKE